MAVPGQFGPGQRNPVAAECVSSSVGGVRYVKRCIGGKVIMPVPDAGQGPEIFSNAFSKIVANWSQRNDR
jgi:hypothetical protein